MGTLKYFLVYYVLLFFSCPGPSLIQQNRDHVSPGETFCLEEIGQRAILSFPEAMLGPTFAYLDSKGSSLRFPSSTEDF